MTKLQLIFKDDKGKTKSLTIKNPKQNLSAETVRNAASKMIEAQGFETADGLPVKTLESAKVINETVTDLIQ